MSYDGSLEREESLLPLDLQEDELLRYGFYLPAQGKGNLLAFPIAANGQTVFSTVIWDLSTNKRIATISDYGRLVFSPDGRYIATGLNVYSLDTQEFLRSFDSESVHLLDLSERILYRGTDNSLRLLDAITLNEIALLLMSRRDLDSFAVQGDSLLLFSEGLGLGLAIRVDGRTGEELARYEGGIPEMMNIWQFTISPDEAYLLQRGIYTSWAKKAPRLWNFATGESIPLPETYVVVWPAFLSDGRLFAWDREREEMVLYDIASNTVTQAFPAEHSEYGDDTNLPPNMVVLSPDEQSLLIGNGGLAKLWSLETGEILWQCNEMEGFERLQFSPNGRYLTYFSGDLYHLMVVDILSHQQFSISQFDTIGSIDFLSDELLHASDEWQDIYFNLDTREFVPAPRAMPKRYEAVFEGNGLLFFFEFGKASTHWESLRIEAADRENIHRLNFPQGVYRLSFSEDGTRLFMNYDDGRIGIWAVED